jgi:gamma-glutamyltranspeptidase
MRFLRVFLSLSLGSAVATISLVSLSARQPVRGRHGMVVAMESIAADVGVEVLKNGGNAIDAAVAVGFAMSATHPYAGNLGGGGYMLIRLADGRTTFIDFREKAPEKPRATCISMRRVTSRGTASRAGGLPEFQARFADLSWHSRVTGA